MLRLLSQILGLLISFISFAMYSSLRPYIGGSDGTLAMVAQIQIFVSLLSTIAFKSNPNAPAMTVILVALLFIAPAFAVGSETFGSRLVTCVIGRRGRPSYISRISSWLVAKVVARLDRLLDVKSVQQLDVSIGRTKAMQREPTAATTPTVAIDSVGLDIPAEALPAPSQEASRSSTLRLPSALPPAATPLAEAPQADLSDRIQEGLNSFFSPSPKEGGAPTSTPDADLRA